MNKKFKLKRKLKKLNFYFYCFSNKDTLLFMLLSFILFPLILVDQECDMLLIIKYRKRSCLNGLTIKTM